VNAGTVDDIPLLHKIAVRSDQAHGREQSREDQDYQSLAYADIQSASRELSGDGRSAVAVAACAVRTRRSPSSASKT
jgi:hypothetical protein